jgi:hypothetical protein
MRRASEHHPRAGDVSREELMKQADEARQRGWDVYFKFSCAYCHERCQFQEPNKLYESGECSGCGKSTAVDVGGFLLAREEKRVYR